MESLTTYRGRAQVLVAGTPIRNEETNQCFHHGLYSIYKVPYSLLFYGKLVASAATARISGVGCSRCSSVKVKNYPEGICAAQAIRFGKGNS